MKSENLLKQHSQLLVETMDAITEIMSKEIALGLALAPMAFEPEDDKDYLYELPGLLDIDKHGHARYYLVIDVTMAEPYESYRDITISCYDPSGGDELDCELGDMELIDMMYLLQRMESYIEEREEKYNELGI